MGKIYRWGRATGRARGTICILFFGDGNRADAPASTVKWFPELRELK